MAEGLAKSIFGSAAEVQSMGSKPCGYLHPWALEAMVELGIDIRDQYSKPLSDIPASFLSQLDYAITLCADEVCPAGVKARHHLTWPFPDPAGDPEESKPEAFRRIRDKMETSIRALAQEILQAKFSYPKALIP